MATNVLPLIGFADEGSILPGIETVTFIVVPIDGSTATEYPGVIGLKMETTQAVAGFGESVQSSLATARWQLRANTVPVVPQHGDKIVSLVSGTWEVDSRSNASLGTRYALDCKAVPS